MGVKFSRASNQSPPNPPTNTHLNSNDNLSSYLQACQLDPDVQTFDSHLHERTTHVINSIAGDGEEGFEVRSLSLDSLRQVAGVLIDMNQEVVKVILECKKDIWNNQDLFALVEDYFEYSVHTLDFFAALDKCLKRARERQLVIQVALVQFEEQIRDSNNDGFVNVKGKYGNFLEEIRKFKEAGDPFTEEFFSMLQTVYKQQLQMFEKLQLRKQKLDKKLKQFKTYRKVSNMIFAAAFIAVIICSVVAAAISAPPVVSALAAAASAPMSGIGKWMNSLWKKYITELNVQRELVSTMEVGTYITIKDLESIRVLVDKLEVHVEGLLENVELFGKEEEEGSIKVVIEEMKKQMEGFVEAIDELGEHGDKYSRDIRRARTVILQRIIKHNAEEGAQ